MSQLSAQAQRIFDGLTDAQKRTLQGDQDLIDRFVESVATNDSTSYTQLMEEVDRRIDQLRQDQLQEERERQASAFAVINDLTNRVVDGALTDDQMEALLRIIGQMEKGPLDALLQNEALLNGLVNANDAVRRAAIDQLPVPRDSNGNLLGINLNDVGTFLGTPFRYIGNNYQQFPRFVGQSTFQGLGALAVPDDYWQYYNGGANAVANTTASLWNIAVNGASTGWDEHRPWMIYGGAIGLGLAYLNRQTLWNGLTGGVGNILKYGGLALILLAGAKMAYEASKSSTDEVIDPPETVAQLFQRVSLQDNTDLSHEDIEQFFEVLAAFEAHSQGNANVPSFATLEEFFTYARDEMGLDFTADWEARIVTFMEQIDVQDMQAMDMIMGSFEQDATTGNNLSFTFALGSAVPDANDLQASAIATTELANMCGELRDGNRTMAGYSGADLLGIGLAQCHPTIGPRALDNQPYAVPS